MSVISAPAGCDEQALITEARAHARRRRRRVALVVIVVLLTAPAGVLITLAAAGSRPVAQAGSRAAIAVTRTGIVTGHLPACFGMPPPANEPAPVDPGTVVVLRGSITTRPDGPGISQLLLPKGPVLAHQYISNNYRQVFRFELPPGHYVLAGSYGGPGYSAFRDATVTAGKVIVVDLPAACK
ncbi:MAG TPA: hypothetical protein VN969_20710 [Streptosporangiaceae bacterium]|nr:hypothetical protein [Streptosporangiaceae bacterium]